MSIKNLKILYYKIELFGDAMQQPEVYRMTSDVAEVKPTSWGRRGSNDHSIERIQVHTILDCEGNRIEGIWKEANFY